MYTYIKEEGGKATTAATYVYFSGERGCVVGGVGNAYQRRNNKKKKIYNNNKVIRHQITADANIPLAHHNRPILYGYYIIRTYIHVHYMYYIGCVAAHLSAHLRGVPPPPANVPAEPDVCAESKDRHRRRCTTRRGAAHPWRAAVVPRARRLRCVTPVPPELKLTLKNILSIVILFVIENPTFVYTTLSLKKSILIRQHCSSAHLEGLRVLGYPSHFNRNKWMNIQSDF